MLGTDHLGREIASRVIWGARTSLAVSVGTLVFAIGIGTFVGGVAGFYGGRLDDLLMRIVDVFLVIPVFFLVITVVALFGSQFAYLILILGAVLWPAPARLFRGSVLAVRNEEYIVAARALGCPNRRTLLRHVLPNAIFPVVVKAPLIAADVILLEASLSFIGLGDPTVISWGAMLHSAQQMVFLSWWMAVFPGVAVSITILSFKLVGDGLLEAISSRV
jgi:peptide/nickel transport system permease protein